MFFEQVLSEREKYKKLQSWKKKVSLIYETQSCIVYWTAEVKSSQLWTQYTCIYQRKTTVVTAGHGMESTRKIANVRIHVERVIGSVRQKYSILGHSVLPIHYLQTDNEDPCLLYKIGFVCCALTNCCKSVVSPE